MADIQLTPFFPLQLVAFPGEQVKLHIFEPRYKQLIQECEDDGIAFVIPPLTAEGIHEYGTEMRLGQVFQRYPGGELDILVEGVCAVHIESFAKHVPNRLYSGGEIVRVENDPIAEEAIQTRLADLYEQFHRLMGLADIETDFSRRNVSFLIGHELAMTMEQKVRLLSLPRESDRQEYIADHLERVIPMVESAQTTRRRTRGNGHVSASEDESAF